MNRKSKQKNINLLCKTKHDKNDEKGTSSKQATTPIAARRSIADEECVSPIQIRCTQDGGDDELDVIWDWNSPQSRIKKTFVKQRKRPLINVSPHIPRKLQTKNNLMPKFTSLRAELEKLSHSDDVINLEEDDDLVINFIEEDFSIELEKNITDTTNVIPDPTNVITAQLECSDLFGDDSFDEEMVKCSQQIEEQFVKPKTIEILLNGCNNIADDSFDAILEEFTDEDMIRLSQETNEIQVKCQTTPVKNSRTIYRTHSTPVHCNLDFLPKNNSSPIGDRVDSLPRTKSAENCTKLSSPESFVACPPEEIEKKRMEAKAKLELRKTQNEIEMKRQAALERLKRNRLQRTKNNSR